MTFDEWWEQSEFSGEMPHLKEPCEMAWNAAMDKAINEVNVELAHGTEFFTDLLESYKVDDGRTLY